MTYPSKKWPKLPKKPLVEAIFELKWNLPEIKPGILMDPHFKLLVGMVYNRLSDEYPFHEELPTVTMPDEIAAYVVQHRFRKDKDQWPLVQIGPGIITLNDTEEYLWENFKNKIEKTVDVLFKTYPNASNDLKIDSLMLRYIDAIQFDFAKENIFSFLDERMKTSINLHPGFFEGTGVTGLPAGFDLRFSFESRIPEGTINLRFTRGKTKESEVLVWETIVRSLEKNAPEAQSDILTWAEEAHALADDWFFKTIDGELLRRFQ